MTKQNIFSLICQNKTVRLSGVLAGFDLSFVFLSFWSCPSCLCSHKTIKHLVAIQYIYCQFLFCIQFCNYNSLHLLLSSLIDWLAFKFLSSVVCFPVWRTLFTFRSLFALPLSVNLTAIQPRPPNYAPPCIGLTPQIIDSSLRRGGLCTNEDGHCVQTRFPPPLDHLGPPMTILGEAFDREPRIREDPVITAGVTYVDVQ